MKLHILIKTERVEETFESGTKFSMDLVEETVENFADDVEVVGELADDVSVTSDLDEINKVAKYGDEFGKMGKYVENPDIKVDWDTFARHASERMKKRGITKDMVESWVQNGKALSQNGGDKFAFISQEGVAIVSKEGKLVTAWGIDNFDDAMKTTVEQLYRK